MLTICLKTTFIGINTICNPIMRYVGHLCTLLGRNSIMQMTWSDGSSTLGVRGPYSQTFFLYYCSGRNENSWTHVNSRNTWGNCCVLYPVLYKRKKYSQNMVKKGVHGKKNSGRTVRPTESKFILIEGEMFALQKIWRVLFPVLFSFSSYHVFKKFIFFIEFLKFLRL